MADSTWKRMVTCVLTLLTFCPPAPEERVKDISILSSGIFIFWGTVHPDALEENDLLRLLLLLFFDMVFFRLPPDGGLYGS